MKGAALICFVIGVAAFGLGWFSGSSWAILTLKTIDATAATLVAGLIAAGVAALAATIAIWGVYSQRVITRRQATIEHIARLKADRSIQDTIQQFIQLSSGPNNLAQWADEDKQGTNENLAIIAVLNNYELMAVGIQRGIFEYTLIKQWQASTIKKFWSASHPFVVALRQRVGVPTLWTEFEKLNGWVCGSKSPVMSLWWTGFG
jgi:hypothetical protein